MFNSKRNEGKDSSCQKGRTGEDIAADYMIGQGLRILSKNFRASCGEIDIIALDGKELVFVEVKARRTGEFGIGADSVGYYKQKKITNTAELYLNMTKVKYESCRFDVASVDLRTNSVVEYVRDAFEAL